MPDKIAVPVSQHLVAELYARAGKSADIAKTIENVFSDFLERTRYDDDLWEGSWLEQRDEEDEQALLEEHGPPSGGYRWGPVFLRNGTRIRMEYKGSLHYALVEHDRIVFDDRPYSPSRLASTIASGTSRNAWRDLWVREPGTSQWVLADDLRRSLPR